MKVFLILSVLILTVPGLAQNPPAARKPLDKDQVMALVAAGMDNAQLAKKIEDLGINFEPTDEYLEALRKAGAQDVLLHALRATKPEPMTEQQVLALVAGGVSSERATALVKQHGIVFVPDDKYLETLRVAGADEALITTVREAGGALPGELNLRTSPNADVYLDGALAGRADYSGTLAVKKLKPGSHALRVTLAAKKDFEQNVTIAPAAASNVEATLTDLPGRVVITSEPGAEVYLDGTSRGKTDSTGKLALADVAPGSHRLQVNGQTKHKDYSGTIDVSAGRETSSNAFGETLPGEIRVRATPGAKVFIDDWKFPLVVQYNGELSGFSFPEGTHVIRVMAEGKPEFRGSVFVAAGQKATFDAPQDTPPPPAKQIDRLYRGSGSEGSWEYLRFFPDGSVLFRNMKGSVADVEQRVVQDKGAATPYRTQGSTIRWSNNMMNGHFCIAEHDWKAVMRGSTLITEDADICDEGKVAKDTYRLVESGPSGAH